VDGGWQYRLTPRAEQFDQDAAVSIPEAPRYSAGKTEETSCTFLAPFFDGSRRQYSAKGCPQFLALDVKIYANYAIEAESHPQSVVDQVASKAFSDALINNLLASCGPS
jgi:hypothetical protein